MESSRMGSPKTESSRRERLGGTNDADSKDRVLKDGVCKDGELKDRVLQDVVLHGWTLQDEVPYD